jgi:hypothetical protein
LIWSRRLTGADPTGADSLLGVNLAGTIYGTVIATAIVAGLTEDDSLGEWEIVAWLLATMVAFWMAHAYANLLAGMSSGGRLPSRRQARTALAHEWAIVQAAAPMTVFLVLGALHVFSSKTAETLAVGSGLAALAGWGWLLARRGDMSLARSLAIALASAALGAVVVGVKLAVE